MNIRRIENKDFKEVENVIREAFWNVYMPGCDEHLIIHKLKDDKCFVNDLSLVIEEDNKIIGAIFYALGKLKNEDKEKEVLFFGPIGVLPDYQGLEYGATLIHESLKLAKEKGYPFVVITGNPDYYHRFGFESCSKYNIYLEGMDKNDEASFFMIRVLNKDEMFKYQGEVSFPLIYEVNKDELEEFEKNFPYKEKEVRDNHLR
jgi:predicted N-acetyltransferase YhbS